MIKTCIVCPVGCELHIEKNGEEIVVTGNSCPRGMEYGKSEMTAPKRVVTALVKGEKQICSVKTDKAILKEKINELLLLLNSAPVKKYTTGEIVFENPLDLGCNIIVTGVQEIE